MRGPNTWPRGVRPQQTGRSACRSRGRRQLERRTIRWKKTRLWAGTSAPARPRVLVVDDDPAIRLICSTWLSLDGYEVLEAADGQDALELAFTEAPAVVLLDLSMPVLDGFGVAAALRADERTRDAPARRSHRRSRPARHRTRRRDRRDRLLHEAVRSRRGRRVRPERDRRARGGEGPRHAADTPSRRLAEEQQQRVGRRVVVREHRHVGSRDRRIDAAADRVGEVGRSGRVAAHAAPALQQELLRRRGALAGDEDDVADPRRSLSPASSTGWMFTVGKTAR